MSKLMKKCVCIYVCIWGGQSKMTLWNFENLSLKWGVANLFFVLSV